MEKSLCDSELSLIRQALCDAKKGDVREEESEASFEDYDVLTENGLSQDMKDISGAFLNEKSGAFTCENRLHTHAERNSSGIFDWGELGNASEERQKRPGSRHGRGGRRPISLGPDRQEDVSELVSRYMMVQTSLLYGEGIEAAINIIIQYISDKTGTIVKPNLSDREKYAWKSKTIRSVRFSQFEMVQAPMFCACYRTVRSRFRRGEGQVMERHASCFWLASNGDLLCSCVGSSLFRIIMLQETTDNGIIRSTCSHTLGMFSFISSLAEYIGVHPRQVSEALYDMFLVNREGQYPNFFHSLPISLNVHSDRLRVVCEVIAGEECVVFCPVRIIRGRTGRNFVCAFCDTAHMFRCRHATVASKDTAITEDIDHQNSDDEGASHGTQRQYSQKSGSNSLSMLPLSPINCKKAVIRDMEVNRSAISGRPYTVLAPRTCSCGSLISMETKDVSEGVIMATMGPCKLLVERFKCTSETCSHTVVAEGRSQQILLFTTTTAATHAFLRRELSGVIIGNGTLSSRLSHYYSLCVENAESGVIKANVRPRSIRTLKKMCAEMLRLMTMEPEPSLFTCGVCDTDIGGNFSRVFAVCVDGVYQGFKKDENIEYLEVSDSIKPYPKTNNPHTCRPNVSFFRQERTFKYLYSAITGSSIICNSKYDACFIAMAIRCVRRSFLPDLFCAGSVCGITKNDFHQDIGEGSYLSVIVQLTNALFDAEVLRRRLMLPLVRFLRRLENSGNNSTLQELGALGRTGRPKREEKPRHLTYLRPVPPLLDFVASLSLEDHSTDGNTCWNVYVRQCVSTQTQYPNPANLREVLNLYRMLMQGPLPQLFREECVSSVNTIGDICCLPSLDNLKSLLETSTLTSSSFLNAHERLLSSNRYIQAGLVSIIELEKTGASLPHARGEIFKNIRMSFGGVLKLAAKVVGRYFDFYKKSTSNHSSITYAKKWGTQRIEDLSRNMEAYYSTDTRSLPTNVFDKALVTGSFFPSLPQIRPLPFDADFENHRNHDESGSHSVYGPCGKDYLQRQSTYTPGSIILSCSCSNSISYGVKVMQRDEGPRCILDTIISRFAQIPRFIVYDFACGLFSSAVNTLWWAISETTIVTDNFHSKNHRSCSPSYLPRCYTDLDLCNTVAHEQNNRPITQLGRSLRNCSYRTYLGLLTYLLTIENIKAKTRATDEYRNRDRRFNANNTAWAYFNCLGKKCLCCNLSNT